MDHFLTHAHTLAESSCTAVRKNITAACHFAAAYTADCGTPCAVNAYELKLASAAGTVYNSQGWWADWGTNAAGMHLPDGGAAVVSPRLSRAATLVYLRQQSDRIAASFPKRKKNLLAADFAVQNFPNRFLRKCPKKWNLARVSSETRFKSRK